MATESLSALQVGDRTPPGNVPIPKNDRPKIKNFERRFTLGAPNFMKNNPIFTHDTPTTRKSNLTPSRQVFRGNNRLATINSE